GKVAMGWYGDWLAGDLRQANVAFDWDVAPLPGRKTQATTLHAHGWGINQASKNLEGAWDLVKFLATQSDRPLMTLVPARIAQADSPTYLKPGQKPANARIFAQMAAWPATRQIP